MIETINDSTPTEEGEHNGSIRHLEVEGLIEYSQCHSRIYVNYVTVNGQARLSRQPNSRKRRANVRKATFPENQLFTVDLQDNCAESHIPASPSIRTGLGTAFKFLVVIPS